MADSPDLTVTLSGDLKDFVQSEVDAGSHATVDAYIRDLVSREREASADRAFEKMKAELKRDFAAPDEDFIPLTAKDIIDRNSNR